MLSITTFLASASWTQVIPFLPLYLEQLGVTDNLSQWSGFVFSMQFAAGIIMAPLWGRLADHRGRKLLTIRAGVFLSAIYILTGMATQAWHVALMRFLNGALTGFIPSSMSLVATNTPKHLSARYVAILQTAGAAGGVVGPVLGGGLAGLFGIRGALYTSGIVVFIATLLVIIIVQEKNKVTGIKRTSFREDFGVAARMPALLSVLGISFLAMVATMTVQPILAIYIAELAKSSSTLISGFIFSMPGLAFVLTATGWVRVGERLGFHTVSRWALIGTALFGIALAFAPSVWFFAVLFFLQGVFLGALRPVSSAIISNDIDPAFHGRAFGLQSSAQTLGGMIGPLITGLVTARLHMSAVFWVTSLLIACGTITLWIVDRKSQASTGDDHETALKGTYDDTDTTSTG